MPRAALTRAKLKHMTAIRARSRRPIRWGGRLSSSPSLGSGPILIGMLSSNTRAWSAVSTGVLPFVTTCFGPRTELAGLNVEVAAAGQPVEAHADGRQVLLDGGGGFDLGQVFDIGGDVLGLDGLERQAVPVAPGKEIQDRPAVGFPRVAVADGRGQELDEAFAARSPASAMTAGTRRPPVGAGVMSPGEVVTSSVAMRAFVARKGSWIKGIIQRQSGQVVKRWLRGPAACEVLTAAYTISCLTFSIARGYRLPIVRTVLRESL